MIIYLLYYCIIILSLIRDEYYNIRGYIIIDRHENVNRGQFALQSVCFNEFTV